MTGFNILLTSAGRRMALLQAFRESAHARGGLIFAGDCDSLAPALYEADEAFLLPGVDHTDYVRALLALVTRKNVRLVVPTIDTELPVLAASARHLAERGCYALVSANEMVAVASDKWCTEQIFRKHGIRTPRSWLPTALTADLPERLFVKPRDGSASAHAYRTQRTHLSDTLVRVPNPIIQEELAGKEITVDALISLEGLPIHYVPRLRIKTVGGESVQGMTLPDEDLRGWLVRVMEVAAGLGARGPITIQAFLTDNGPVLTEINPRFGGGFPLTYAAGGSYPEWVIRMVSGERLEPRIGEYRRGLYMTRYYVERFVEAPICT